MAFPRSFKSQTWFVRLSSGEIESASSSALERSFHCGLVHARTQVRAVGTHVWTTLGEVAEIKDGPVGSLSSASSLSPVAMDEIEPAPPKDGEAPWHVRNFGDASTFRSGVARPIASILGVVAIACVLALAMRFSSATASGAGANLGARSRTFAHGATAASSAPRAKEMPHAVREAEHASPRGDTRFAKEEVRRLREQDLARRMRGDDKPRAGRATSRTPLVPPLVVRPKFLQSAPDPIQRSGNRFDPLNGAL